MNKYFKKIIGLVSITHTGLLFVSFLLLFQVSCAPTTSHSPLLLPGAKVYDVTKPENWGGTLRATPNDPTDDDALAINQAIQAAFDFVLKNSGNTREVYQQIILIPKGDYHLESTIILPRTNNSKEKAIWIFGEGIDKTRFILKSANEIGEFG